MEFTEQKQMLLDKANCLLKFVKQKEMFGGIHDVMDDEHIKALEEWLIVAKEFVQKYSNDSINDYFESNSWIINGERVSIERIDKILSIIENIKENS